ncbi:MAG TPA: hypothetical protein VFZ58_04485 [Candidatus Saccharimonadales bacterium]
MSYVAMLSDPKIPWSLKRTWRLIKAFFTGIVPNIPKEIVEQRRVNWGKLELDAKQRVLEWTRNRAKNRRASMKETAERSNYMLVGLALFGGLSSSLLASDGSSSASKLYIRLGFTLIAFSTAVLFIAICAKWKVWRRPRQKGESEGDEYLANTVKIQEEVKTKPQPNMELYYEYESYVTRLHKVKILLLVERRSQSIVCYAALLGFALMTRGAWIR